MLLEIDRLFWCLWYYCKAYFFFGLVTIRVVTGLYYRLQGFTNWYLGFIPFIHLKCRDDGNKANRALLVAIGFCSFLAIYGTSAIWTLVVIVLNAGSNLMFASDTLMLKRPKCYAFIPFYRFFTMLAEVMKKCEFLNKLIPTKKQIPSQR